MRWKQAAISYVRMPLSLGASVIIPIFFAAPALAQGNEAVTAPATSIAIALALIACAFFVGLKKGKSTNAENPTHNEEKEISPSSVSAANSLGLDHDFLEELLTRAPIAVAILIDRTACWSNAVAKSLINLQPNTSIDAIFVDNKDTEAVEDALKQKGVIRDFAVQLYVADGSIRDFSFTAMNISLDGTAALLVWATDISELKHAEKALIEARFSTEASLRAKNDFLARMSHEIRTPMNAILGMSHLCLQTKLSSKQRNHVSKIQEAAQMLLGVINDILDFSKAGSDSLSLEKGPFYLDGFLDSLNSSMSQRAKKKGLEYKVEKAETLPNRLVGDALRISQVLQILLGNAIKFTEHGTITLTVEAVEEETAWVDTHFTVKDTGIGIDSEQLESLFLPFSMGDDSSTRKFGGTGLGLAISKSLVDLMGGNIWVESKPGEGSIFHVVLRLEKEVRGTVRIPADLDFSQMEVMVVEQNESEAQNLLEQVQSMGFRTLLAPSGQVALEIMEQVAAEGRYISLLLLNWNMEGLDGIETAHMIQGSFPADEVPIMVLVCAPGADVPTELLKVNGITACLEKPLNKETVKRTLCRLLDKTDGPCADEESECAPPEEARPMSIEGAHILLVEDNEINQEIALALLEDEGMNVDVANNGEEAVAAVADAPDGAYQLIFMDIQMPVMDGLSAARAIRHAGNSKDDLPIVAMTAHARETDREQSMEAGMNDHITKPLDPAILHDTLIKWIDPAKIPADSKAPEKAIDPDQLVTPEDIVYTSTGQRITLEDGHLPDLSRQAGLESVGGNKALYAKLLRKFQDSCRTSDTDIVKALEADNLELAVRLAHTVKGVAASLGLIALSQVGASVERNLKESQNLEDPITQALLEKFSEELAQALKAVQEYLDETGEASPQQSTSSADNKTSALTAEEKQSAISLLNHLVDNLEADWGAVMEAHETIQGVLKDSTLASPLYNLTVAVENFDVSQAKDAARKVIAILNDSAV